MPVVEPTTPPAPEVSRLRAARQAAGLDLRAFGRLMGHTHPAISRIERGREVPSGSFRRKAADALGLDEAWLFEDALR